jgi:hypothetical protein
VNNPSSPRRVGGNQTSGSASDLASLGSHAYVTDGEAGLQIIDISNPVNPFSVGGFDTGGFCGSVVVSGTFAYEIGLPVKTTG